MKPLHRRPGEQGCLMSLIFAFIAAILFLLALIANQTQAQVFRIKPLPPAYAEIDYDRLGQTYKQVSNDLLYARTLKFTSGTNRELNYTSREGFYSFQFDENKVCSEIFIRLSDHLLAEEFVGIFRNDYVKMDQNIWVNLLTQKSIWMIYIPYTDEVMFVIRRI